MSCVDNILYILDEIKEDNNKTYSSRYLATNFDTINSKRSPQPEDIGLLRNNN